ncbi:MAG: deoxyribonuclease IV [Gemmatimonadota bacterium]|nr:deoxyribonuclease IV [Gemmatimonadota bacterium]
MIRPWATEATPLAAQRDEVGAHVSAAGGVDRAPGRATEIGCANLQLFTKQPSRWAEPAIDPAVAETFAAAREEHGIRVAGAHDSYLINLASPDPVLRERSSGCFEGELRRCVSLGLDFLVTHPGNATDGDYEAGVARNADGLGRALERVDGPTAVLLELTAGSGTSIGSTFERLAAILAGIPREHDARVGVCVDTCHAFAAGYDLAGDWDGVWTRFHDVLGLARLRLVPVNASKNPLGSRVDRHEHLGRGTLGTEPFRRLMNDERFSKIPKLLETPKEGDPLTWDVRNLEFLRGLRNRPARALREGR